MTSVAGVFFALIVSTSRSSLSDSCIGRFSSTGFMKDTGVISNVYISVTYNASAGFALMLLILVLEWMSYKGTMGLPDRFLVDKFCVFAAVFVIMYLTSEMRRTYIY